MSFTGAEDVWERDVCRSCDADILWATHHETEKRMPFDADPIDAASPRGLFALVEVEERLVAYPAKDDDDGWFRSHFATCPNAEGWRGRSRGRGLASLLWFLLLVGGVAVTLNTLVAAMVYGAEPDAAGGWRSPYYHDHVYPTRAQAIAAGEERIRQMGASGCLDLFSGTPRWSSCVPICNQHGPLRIAVQEPAACPSRSSLRPLGGGAYVESTIVDTVACWSTRLEVWTAPPECPGAVELRE